MHTELFDGAVYALMARELVLEVRIARLFSGIQGALVFALQEPRGKKRAQVRSLYEKFLIKYGSHFNDLWPLLGDPQGGPSLSDLRNAVAHGETFTKDDFLALSYASQNLEWMLERIWNWSLSCWNSSRSSAQNLPRKTRLSARTGRKNRRDESIHLEPSRARPPAGTM
jgi:hypothetical protein